MASIIEIEDDEVLKCPICKEIATKKCAGCKKIAYCDRPHQKQHWKIHKPSCQKLPYEILNNQILGRYIKSSDDIKTGDQIIKETPIIVGPKITLAEPVCLGCHKPVDPIECGMNRCPKCFWPACSQRCSGLTDAHTHSPECAILKLGGETILAYNDFKYEAILPLRCLILQRRSPKKYEDIKLMEAHMRERVSGTEVHEEISAIVNYLQSNFLRKMPADILDDISSECLHWICGIIDVNALDIDQYTQGLYSSTCLLEHSCLPNTKHIFEPITNVITVKAALNITKGTHISTMYTNALWGTQARREHLATTKYFNCLCERCSDATELCTNFSALKCLNVDSTKCNSWLLPVAPLDRESDWQCSNCPAVLNANDVRYLTTQLGDQVDKLVQDNPNIMSLEDMLKKLLELCHPNHYHCYAVKHSLIQLYGTQKGYLYIDMSNEALNKKIAMCRELIWVTKKLDPGYCRLTMYLGVLLYELHSALMDSVRREKDKSPKEKIKKIVVEAKELLEENLRILESEPPYTTGYDMAVLTKISLADVDKTLKKYNK